MNMTITPSPVVPSSGAAAAAGSAARHVPADIADTVALPTAGDVGTHMLPAPPRRGGRIEKAELLTLKALQRARTPEGDAWARRLHHNGHTTAWLPHARQLRQDSGLVAGMLGTVVLGGTMTAAAAVSAAEKYRHGRPRPAVIDPSIKPLVKAGMPAYPSGHTATAYAAASLIATLNPPQKDAVNGLARDVAFSRLYAGVHYPSDVVAGAALGTAIGTAAGRGALRGASLVQGAADELPSLPRFLRR